MTAVRFDNIIKLEYKLYPEMMEICGRLICVLDDGREIDFGSSIYGAYLNSETVYHLKSVRLSGIRRVLFIENKANYIWYLGKEKKEDELIVFHRGFFSPAKGHFFYKLHQVGKEREIIVYEGRMRSTMDKKHGCCDSGRWKKQPDEGAEETLSQV